MVFGNASLAVMYIATTSLMSQKGPRRERLSDRPSRGQSEPPI